METSNAKDPLLTIKQVAHLLGRHHKTVERHRREQERGGPKRVPAWQQDGRNYFFRQSAVDEFCAARERF